mmetsp:Transcript_27542/g.79254  ORF Transcript_27542/g.79254 Transcript_27542/m.79254 type:complete len:254 (+) Transcript_27542:483-1244(+)
MSIVKRKGQRRSQPIYKKVIQQPSHSHELSRPCTRSIRSRNTRSKLAGCISQKCPCPSSTFIRLPGSLPCTILPSSIGTNTSASPCHSVTRRPLPAPKSHLSPQVGVSRPSRQASYVTPAAPCWKVSLVSAQKRGAISGLCSTSRSAFYAPKKLVNNRRAVDGDEAAAFMSALVTAKDTRTPHGRFFKAQYCHRVAKGRLRNVPRSIDEAGSDLHDRPTQVTARITALWVCVPSPSPVNPATNVAARSGDAGR